MEHAALEEVFIAELTIFDKPERAFHPDSKYGDMLFRFPNRYYQCAFLLRLSA
jgi:hypothetical protein